MSRFYAMGIKYDTDGLEIAGLPCNLVVECEDEEEVVDTISDMTGWLVESVMSISRMG